MLEGIVSATKLRIAIMHHTSILVCRDSVLLKVVERALKYLKKEELEGMGAVIRLSINGSFKFQIKYCPSPPALLIIKCSTCCLI